MKLGHILLSLLASAAQFGAARAADRDVRIPENLQQGQLVIGYAAQGLKIEYAGHRLRIADDGTFVFGIERDAAATIALHIRTTNGKVSDLRIPVEKREYHVERIEGLPQKTVTPDAKTKLRIEREHKHVADARKRDDPREDFLHGFSLPVEGARISDVYGSQRIDNGIAMSPHFGLDMAVPEGTPIHAPAPGVVTFAEPDLVDSGGTVLIDHGFGLTSSFLHMSRLDVKVGDRIERGQVIGAAGMTGRATGPHVHWGFNWFETRLDPALLAKP